MRTGEGARRSSPLGGRRPHASARRAFRVVCAWRAPSPALAPAPPRARGGRTARAAALAFRPPPSALAAARPGPARPGPGSPLGPAGPRVRSPRLPPGPASQLGACAGRVAVAGVSAAVGAAAAASVSQSVPSNGGRRGARGAALAAASLSGQAPVLLAQPAGSPPSRFARGGRWRGGGRRRWLPAPRGPPPPAARVLAGLRRQDGGGKVGVRAGGGALRADPGARAAPHRLLVLPAE